MSKRPASHWLKTILIAAAVPALGVGLIAMARLYAWSFDQDWKKVVFSAVTWGNVAEWAVAVSTVLLAFVAVGQEWIRAWWDSPEFEVTTACAPPDCVMVPVHSMIDGSFIANAMYLRIRVKNVGRATARYLEVYADSLHKLCPDGVRNLVTAFPVMNLKWANTAGDIYIRRLAPDMPKHCDICHVIDPAGRAGTSDDRPDLRLTNSQTSMAFDLQSSPNHKGHIVGPGTYLLEVLVAAENRRPVRRTIEIELKGPWSPDETTMLRDHMSIKVLRG